MKYKKKKGHADIFSNIPMQSLGNHNIGQAHDICDLGPYLKCITTDDISLTWPRSGDGRDHAGPLSGPPRTTVGTMLEG